MNIKFMSLVLYRLVRRLRDSDPGATKDTATGIIEKVKIGGERKGKEG